MEHSNHFNPRYDIGKIVAGVVVGVTLAFLFGFFVMLLWNWLMVGIFKLPHINYWQAWGLLVLSHLLFKIGGGHHHHKINGHHDHLWRKKFKKKFEEKFDNDKTEEK
jgi:hypothetical protein